MRTKFPSVESFSLSPSAVSTSRAAWILAIEVEQTVQTLQPTFIIEVKPQSAGVATVGPITCQTVISKQQRLNR